MKKRILSLILAAIMLLVSFAVSGCDNGQTDVTTAASDETTAAPAETTEPQSESIKLIENGIPTYKVVRPDALKTSDDAVVQAMRVRTSLNKFSTKQAEITTDWTKDGTHKAEDIEIVVGMCNHPEVEQVVASMAYGDFAVKAIGNKIIVIGFTKSALVAAADRIVDLAYQYKTQNDDGTITVDIPRSALESVFTKSKKLSALPMVDGGTFSSYYDAGDDCEELIITQSTPEIYNQYIKKLESAGYTQHVTKSVKDNIFTTLYTKDNTINVGYYGYEKSIRIIVEPYSDKTLIPLESENKYEVVTTSQISMIGLEYLASDGSYVSNALSILIRISDGRFIVVDGGFGRVKDAQMLVSAMKEQSKDYISKTKTITVAAWIITHAHGDHNGMINSCYSTIKSSGIKVEQFLVNFISETERVKSVSAYSNNWSTTEGSSGTTTRTAAGALGAEVVTVHVGQDFWLADLRLEVLYTIESYGPALVNALNTTSLIMKMTFTDPKTKEQTVYMSTGDATGPGFLITSKMFGDYLKSDIVQVAHHGYTTWGTENGTTAAYILMAPATLAWPQGITAYPNYVDKSYNAVLHNKSTNPNYKETYVAGSEGDITIFPLPYKVGSAIKGKIS